ncbi:MAG: hydrogenase expression/formation protein HypE [Bdellovibrionales bacterium RIFOXYC1_FULL_54_43]|nr:MAG: hydrogenase expression/formation protein HypE [Bdellovibrionales bacterium RIFOXYC1_FULL_54_43]OFZ83386.1 MAG: hydrogenase expression/formation protein HypE [Bdellovibrionales bacterium RIFOXYD1_FULL_55_31]
MSDYLQSHKKITLAHGNGGKLSHELITRLFVPAFTESAESLNPPEANPNEASGLQELADSARIIPPSTNLVFTTDSHVVNPIFFPGGDIGKLAVTGTVNDLAVMGAKPLYLTSGFIVEDGFEMADLARIIDSMAKTARECGVRIVAGDTKVVEKGAADRIFINTSGIGVLLPHAPAGAASIRPGDAVIVTGTLGDHGIAIYAGREGINLKTELKSDCAVVSPLVERAMQTCSSIRVMRDPTRGGLATTLNEFTHQRNFGIEVFESRLPVREEVRGVCELLGFDPIYVANEGKLVLIVPPSSAEDVLKALKEHPLGYDSAIIGRVTERAPGRVFLRTVVGGERILDMLIGDMLPRIC